MNEPSIELVDEKIFNCPGFYEGIVEASAIFVFRNQGELTKSWNHIRYFLSNYEYIDAKMVNGGGNYPVKPFQFEEDLEIAKYILSNYFK